jgi:peptide methionine sulfoxide reductase MsrA
MHSPTHKTNKQYRSAVFYVDDEQKAVAEEVVAGLRASSSHVEIYADVEPATRFYLAEEYHQDFLSKRVGDL